MASSSSSSHSFKHEVFLSFRGEDTRKNFVDHLYTALVQQGIQTYKDDKTLDRGESIGPTLVKAIQESRIAVVVFSKNYADSSWCLDELAHIMECMDTRGQIVMPIFYHVDPSDVRKLKRKYEEAFSKHEVGNKHKLVESWRKALEKAGSISGWAITDNTHEAICVKEIVGTISDKLPPLITNINKDLIGIETRLRDLKSKLEIGSDGVRIVGIWGVGGGGKTTLASAAYANISRHFEAHCFLQNIREETKKDGLKKLQKNFLSLVLKTKDIVVRSEIEGRSMIKGKLCNKRVLVVLDDVDNLNQLEALAGSHDWFGEGSRIIITTRDKHLLTRHTDKIYEVSLLSHDEAIELFNKHAYRKDQSIDDYEMLSKDVVSYADGLPLALEILGSFLYDKHKDEWKSALAKLKCIPNVEVTERLKISYDVLEPDQQTLFLDIACFFRGRRIDEAMMVLDACDLHPVIGVKVLVQKSLIKVSDGVFDVHDLIEEMARNIVRGGHLQNPEKYSRIWNMDDIEYLCHMGADAPPMDTEVLSPWWTTTCEHPGVSNVVEKMKKLRWIDFDKYPTSSFPSNFQPRKLGYLRLHCSQQNELWHGYKLLPNLKILHLSSSKNLIKTPDFEGLPCLERLTLKGCSSLKEIHPSIGYHKRLVFVDMSWCSGLERFPPIIQMKKLETLNLCYCTQLQQLPDIQSNMDSLVTLDLSDTGIEIIPPFVGRFCTNLVSFDLRNCHKLKRIEGNLHLLKNVKFLYLSGNNFQDLSVSLKLPQFPRFLRKLELIDCKLGDGDIPYDIYYLLNLQILDLSYNIFSQLPSGISRNPCLRFLNLSYCTSLVELLHLPSSIAILKANCCYSLERLGDLSDYKWLWKVSFQDCNKLIYGGRVLHSMLEVNAAADRFMSVLIPNVEPSVAFGRLVTLQLPYNWYNDFTGFLLLVRDFPWTQRITLEIVIKQEMSSCRTLENKPKYDKPQDKPKEEKKMENKPKEEKKKKEEEEKTYAKVMYREYPEQIVRVGYVPFSSLSHIPWLNPAYTKNISFHTNASVFSVSLVPSKRKIGDLNEHSIDYSECWNEEHKDTKIFEIIYDSKSSEIQMVWRH